MKFFDNFFDIRSDTLYSISGMTDDSIALYVYDTFIKNNKSVLVVTSDLYKANILYTNLLNYTRKVLFFPMDDFLTTEAIAISPEFKTERIHTLSNLSLGGEYIVITNLMGFLRYLPSKELWKNSFINLRVGDKIERDKFLQDLYNLGYEKDIVVTNTGKFGVRGYVIDVFSPLYEDAIRIEFWDDEIDGIKFFDVDSQLSKRDVKDVTIYPFTEFLLEEYPLNTIRKQKYLSCYGSVYSISDYIDNNLCFYFDYETIKSSYKLLLETIHDYDIENNDGIKTSYINSIEDIKIKNRIYFTSFDNNIARDIVNYKYGVKSIDNYNGNYELLTSDINKYISNNKTVILCISSRNVAIRVCSYLDKLDIVLTNSDEIIKNKINLINKKLGHGFIYDDYVILSEDDIFKNSEIKKFKSKYKIGTRINNIIDLKPGDYVVHEMYGIGIYDSLCSIKKGDMVKDYIKIIYANNDSLYVPVENIDRISKFSLKEGIDFKINSLSNDNWQKKKNNVKKKLEDMADELLKVSCERELKDGFAFSKDTEEQALFDSEFVYTETGDQIRAINTIKKEMEKSKPMDMLLCGDVGYGKTEVAFRAMFKAVNDSKQVAYLCPTTILSQQQYLSAKERFQHFPIRIELLNRFVDKSKQDKILKDLEDGKVDIVFGTHRLLSDDIKYKDLGLLIVDEEQRFGVTHKEKIKKYKSTVDVLTLSATPIPRTLQMSMAGIRNLALIETPPKERYPIQTYVLEENNLVIKDAIYKELSRGGQTFILFNSVEKIENKAYEISKLVPEAKVDFAHGRMTKSKLEEKMNDFINNKFDVLVCTTIIETGIDIPNVNTLIILDADHFGLSQLYQIRGRIGRSNKIGYAYLMYEKNKALTEVAIKRLDTIREFTELGSGFKIAMRDLSIRGAGDILGSEQSGFVDSIGIDLYLKLLNEAVRKSKGEEVCEEDDKKKDKPLIEVSTHINDKYIPDSLLKIEIHKIINTVSSKETFSSVKSELEDRFGKLDQELIIYMYEEWFEKLAKELGVENVIKTNNYIDIELPEKVSSKIDGEKLFQESYQISRMFRFSYKNNKIHVILDIIKLEKHFLIYLIDVLNVISNMVKKGKK